MIEAEGPFWMEKYPGAGFRDLVADCARRCQIPLERGLRELLERSKKKDG